MSYQRKSASREHRRRLRIARRALRRMVFESLEDRRVMAHVDPIYAPGTPDDVIQRYEDIFTNLTNSLPPDIQPFQFTDTKRWTQTATNGGGLTQGDPTTLRWSLVPDGTPIPGFAGEPAAPSNLISFLDGIYGTAAGPLTNRPWFPIMSQVFNTWASQTGVDYVFEQADDGTAFSAIATASPGIVNVRGDIRVGGHVIDGNSGILAYNFFPNNGEMVIDTGDFVFYGNVAGNSLGLRNVLAHEAGHGLGVDHVCPVNQTKLMEPFVTYAFDGPQHDDLLAVHRGYGDRLEPSDTRLTASDLGILDGTQLVTAGLSIDGSSDIDLLHFKLNDAQLASFTLSPVGFTYLQGPQVGACNTGTSFNSKIQNDLKIELLAADATTVLATANSTAAGLDEVITNFQISSPGDYYLKISGASNNVQLYDLTTTFADLPPGPRLISVQPNNSELLAKDNPFDAVVPNQRDIAPRELTIHFDANSALDPATLSGIQLTRAGFDDRFSFATAATDFNTNAAVVVQFDSLNLGPIGNLVSLEFSKADLGTSTSEPAVDVVGKVIRVTLNTNPAHQTTAQDVVNAINSDSESRLLVKASIRNGVATTNVTANPITFSPLGLSGANAASAISNFGSASPLEVRFYAATAGAVGNNVAINFSSANLGAGRAPTVSVTGTTITVTLNLTAGSQSTVQQVLSAIASNAAANSLVKAQLVYGNGAFAITPAAVTNLRLSGANDVTVVPGWIGLGDTGREVIMRFAEPLPDDLYRLEIFGEDNAALGITALKSVQNRPFEPSIEGADREMMEFNLDLGAQIVAVVPQPINRIAGALQQDNRNIIVYFNEDDLAKSSAETPAFYQLIDTATNSFQLPQTVVYDANLNRATLTFASSLTPASGISTYRLRVGNSDEPNNKLSDAIQAGTLFSSTPFTTTAFSGDDATSSIGGQNLDIDLYRFHLDQITTITASVTPNATLNTRLRLFDATGTPISFNDGGGINAVDSISISLVAGTYFLGVSGSGNNNYDPVTGSGAAVSLSSGSYQLSITTTALLSINDDNSSYGTATNLGALGTGGQSIQSQIEPQVSILMPPYPGGNDEPGHREIPAESHIGSTGTTPYAPSGIATMAYYFPDIYGTDPSGTPLANAITENQKNRAREIFEIISSFSGIQFIESTTGGLGVVTGDPRAVDPSIPPGSVGGIAGNGLVVMNGNINWGQSEYGGAWFSVAFHEIGHSIGLEHAYDLPAIMGSSETTFGSPPGEPVFPTDHDKVHLQRILRPDSTDIDLFQFQLTQPGRFSAETIAERLPTTSLLNTVLSLFDSNHNLLARNDDYFSNDSFIDVPLKPGTYYIGVSSTGNSQYDPIVSDTGFGGTTDGNYELNLNFAPTPKSAMVDQTGTAVDGDADGVAGGAFDFWFQTGATLFVDKNNDRTVGVDGNGSISNPFDQIDAALAAADASPTAKIVRVVGNGGTDGSITTLSDNRPYLIGFDNSDSELPDGSTVAVPKNVTLMIDAGAILKLQKAIIDVGTSSNGVSRSEGAIQVLGTPSVPTYFRSFRDDTVGGNSDGNSAGPAKADWGGIVLRDDSDYEANGIFLNSIINADIQHAGGKVNVSGIDTVFSPIHIDTARPTIAYNTISNSSYTAISANPNSFDDRDGRIGPDIHGNHLLNNSINGLLIRIQNDVLTGAPEQMDVSGRFDDSDVVHVVTDNVSITGNPGGPLDTSARLSGRLAIDPGIVVKLAGSRIEATRGASNLIAEGTDENPIIFTALADDRYGTGGTFDSTNDGQLSSPVPGNWGGLIFNPISSGSIDHAVIAYGGGSTPIEGGFDNFNAVEMTQARVRLSNSVLEHNGQGGSATSRNGRGRNVITTIFVRGAQPIIVDNIVRNNAATMMSLNANSMLAKSNPDWGRSTSFANIYSQFSDNDGPLVRLNRLQNNLTNGLEVRGGELLTESIWDDTDIVHILRDEIIVLNHHTFSGLRLESSDDESLVIKLAGNSAGFTADGTPLDINDRIGGTVQVVGMPGHPVVMTSLNDCRIGAGFTPDGKPQTDTTNTGATCDISKPPPPTPTGPFTVTSTTNVANALRDALLGPGVTPVGNAIFVGSATSAGFFTGGGTSVGIQDGIILSTGAATNANGPNASDASTGLASGAGDPTLNTAFGVATRDTTYLQFDFTSSGGDLYFNYVFASEEYNEFANSPFNDVFGFFLDGQNIALIPGTSTPVTINNINGGNPFGTGAVNPQYYVNNDISDGGSYLTDFGMDGFTKVLTAVKLSVGAGKHTIKLAVSDVTDTAFDTAVLLQAGSFSDTPTGTAGDWRGIKLDRYSNDRNVSVVNEFENDRNIGGDANRTPNTSQFLGQLAGNENGGDDIRRLGFEVHGTISQDQSTDVDVYSFDAPAGTQVWLDIDRTSPALDAMVELIDSSGKLLARSLDNDTVQSFGVPAETMLQDTHLGGDFYSSNRNDPGMRVVLNGSVPGKIQTYYVRVRSTPQSSSLDNLNGGLTRGDYQLQVRLRQTDEKPGSVVRYADMRFATNAVEVLGLPSHSPLVLESTEAYNRVTGVDINDVFANAQDLGNLLTSDRNTLATSGTISAATDVDWYRFNLDYDLIQVIGGASNGGKTWATMFDIDYADGLVRPDATLSIFDANGQLVLVSRDSNIHDDQPRVGEGADFTDLTRGSVGKLDPFIGTQQLPAGNPGQTTTYYVAVSSNQRLPQTLNATFQSTATSPLIRLEPITSVRRVVEDHIGFTGYTTGTTTQSFTAPVLPDEPAILDISSSISLSAHVTPFTLADVPLYLSSNNTLRRANPFSGALSYQVGTIATGTSDIAMRTDGRLFAYESLAAANTAGQISELNVGVTAAPIRTVIGGDSIPNVTVPAIAGQLTTDLVDAFAFERVSATNQNAYYAVRDTAINASYLYLADNVLASGFAVAGGTPFGRLGAITGGGVTGFTTGMAFDTNGTSSTTLYGVNANGQFYSISTGNGAPTLINTFPAYQFSGLTLGPQNVENQRYANMLFASTSNGTIVALNTFGVLQTVFDSNGDGIADSSSISTGFGNTTGLAFSPLDFNLWHPTMRRSNDAGHGINDSFDNSRDPSGNKQTVTVFDDFGGLRADTHSENLGGASFYFGLEQYTNNPAKNAYFGYQNPTTQYGIYNSAFQQDLTSNPDIGTNYNLPGGAFGTLTTNSFNLEAYSRYDKPTLYFNYFLDTENAAGSKTTFVDSARVFISPDGGNTWEQLTTNNSILSSSKTPPVADAELPPYLTVSATPYAPLAPNQQVQEMFDNTGTWRQARVDLGKYAGNSNLRLRFDFSTAGSVSSGVAGTNHTGTTADGFGIGMGNIASAQRNDFEGFYIDDIIIGFAERGEMVTGAPSKSTTFFDVPANPLPGVSKESLVGPYNLEIRRGTEYVISKKGDVGLPISGTLPDTLIFQTFDTNDRLSDSYSIRMPDGTLVTDGDAFIISDGIHTNTFEFDINNSYGSGNIPVPYTITDSAQAIALTLATAINNTPGLNVTADVDSHNVVVLDGAVNVAPASNPANLTAAIASSTLNENGSNTATVSITREGSIANPLTVNLSAPVNGTRITFPSSVIIPAGASSTTFAITGTPNTIAEGTQTVVLRPSAIGFVSVTDSIDVLDDDIATLTVTMVQSSLLESASPNSGVVIIGRNTPLSQAESVTLVSLDGTELTFGGALTSSAVADHEPNDSITTAQNLDNDNWSLGFAADIGDAALNTSQLIPHLTIRGTGDGTADYYSFTVSNSSQRVILDIDNSSIAFDSLIRLYDSNSSLITSNNDALSALGQSGSTSGTDSYIDTVLAPGVYVVEVLDSVNGQILSGSLYDLNISIAGHQTAGGLPTTRTVVIPANSSSIAVSFSPLDDFINDGAQVASIVAHAQGFQSGTANVTINDAADSDQLSVTLTQNIVAESAGAGTVFARVSRTRISGTDLVVNLISTDTTEATTQATITIPAGSLQSPLFPIGIVNDDVVDGTQSVRIYGFSPTLRSGFANLSVTDDGVDTLAAFVPTWRDQGPSPAINGEQNIPPLNLVTGAIQTVVTHPTDANIAFVGSTNGGIWRTDNATQANVTWIPQTDNYPSLSIGAMEFDPTDTNSNTLIAGIGSTSSLSGVSGALNGVLRTTDGGVTWTQLGTTALAGQNITSVAARGNTLLAASDNTWGGGLGGGLFRSTDGGTTWTNISGAGGSGLPPGPISDLVGSPSSNSTFYAAILGATPGIYQSTDSGANWTQITTGATLGALGPVFANLNPTNKIELAVHSSPGNTAVFASVIENNQLAGVFRSLNGAAFAAYTLTAPNPNAASLGLLHSAIAAHPTNPALVFVAGDRGGAGGQNAIVRLDGTTSTQLVNGTFNTPHFDYREFAFDANGNLLLTSDGGVFRLNQPATNLGSWTSLNGNLSVFEVHDIAFDTLTGTIVAGTQDNGVVNQILPGSTTWDHIVNGDGGNVAIDNSTLASSGQSIRYVSGRNLSSFQRQVYDANNNLVSATIISTATIPTADLHPLTPFELNVAAPQRILIGGIANLYESLNQGLTITRIATGIGANSGGPLVYGGYRNGIANPDVLYSGWNSTVALRQTAGGPVTATASQPTGIGTIADIALNPSDWWNAYVIDDNQVFVTSNRGNSWTEVTGGLSAGILRTITYIPSDGFNPDSILVGGSDGVFAMRTDSPGVWTPYGLALPHAPVFELQYVPSTETLYAATFGRGVWSSAATGTAAGSNVRVDITGATSFSENAGGAASSATISRTGPTTTPLVVQLTSSDNSELTLNGSGLGVVTVTIPAGSSSVVVSLDAVNDNILDGTQTVIITPFAKGYNGVSGVVDVNDDSADANTQLTISVTPSSINEGGTITGTVSRTGDISQAVDVAIYSRDRSEATTPLTVTIPAGAASQSFSIPTIVDGIYDLRNTAIISGYAAGIPVISTSIDVDDVNATTLSLAIGAGSVLDTDGNNATTGTVSISNPSDRDLVINLWSSDTSEATVPTSVTIAAGQTSATFPISAISELIKDGTRNVEIAAYANGFTSAIQSLDVISNAAVTQVGIIDVNYLGDRNFHRQQGQILIESNIISDVSFNAILVDAGQREAGGRPNPGGVLNGPVLNAATTLGGKGIGQAPGVTITNNLIVAPGQAGIRFSGDPNTGNVPLAVVPFGKIINNTIYGNVTPTGIGINVTENAAPTILNNIIANLATGISIDSSPGAGLTVVGTSLFQGNTNNGYADSTGITLVGTDPLFVDPSKLNFYLRPGSKAIDSANDKLIDRPSFTAVKSPLGLPASDAVAPDRDLFGQKRADDGTVAPPPGFGTNIFKDRGAIDRVDATGPFGIWFVPEDNDASGIDHDPATTVIQITDPDITYGHFDILLADGVSTLQPLAGSGIDGETVVSEAITVTRDGFFLSELYDYRFGYNPTSDLLRFTPQAGIWEPGSAYVITLNNKDRFVATAPRGSLVADGDSFTITDATGARRTYEFERGYSINIPQTLTMQIPIAGGGVGGIIDGNNFTILDNTTPYVFEFDRNNNTAPNAIRIPYSLSSTQEDVANAVVTALQNLGIGLSPRNLGNGKVHLGSLAQHTLVSATPPLTFSGQSGGVKDGDQFQIQNGAASVTFEYEDTAVGNGRSAGTVGIAFNQSNTNQEIADLTASAIRSATATGLPTAKTIPGGIVEVGGSASHVLTLIGTPAIVINGSPGVAGPIQIQVPLVGAGPSGVTDGETFSITLNGVSSVFEFDIDGVFSPSNTQISIFSGASQDSVANSIISVLLSSGLSLAPTYLGNGAIQLNETRLHVTDFTLSPSLSVTGVPGGAVPISYSGSYTSLEMLESIVLAINQNTTETNVTSKLRGGDTFFVDGAKSVAGITNFFLSAIRDRAGNALRSNQLDGETRFTILLPGTEVDFGDAPDTSHKTLFANDGARHVIAADNPLYLGSGVTGETDALANSTASGDGLDDGVQFVLPPNPTFGPLNPNTRATEITVTSSGVGFLDAWIDWDRNGSFEDSDRIFASIPVHAGSNLLTISTPSTAATGLTMARFRLSFNGNLASYGITVGGEVEDYQFEIKAGTPPQPVDDIRTVKEVATATTYSFTGINGVLGNFGSPGSTNDRDADNDSVTALLVSGTSHGTVTLASDGSFTYAPEINYSGTDSFVYRLLDSTGLYSNENATVHITVTDVNDSPTAGPDTASTTEDRQLTIPLSQLLANDSSGPISEAWQSLTLVPNSATSSMGGTVTLSGSNIIYTPKANFAGIDTFVYQITDNGITTGNPDPKSALGTVTITVTEVNDEPIAGNDTTTAIEDLELQIPVATLLLNDAKGPSDATDEALPNVQQLSITSISVFSANGGIVQLNNSSIPNFISYTPPKDFFGTDSFTYVLQDNGKTNGINNFKQAIGTVTVTVTPVNDAPVAQNDALTTAEDVPLSVPTSVITSNDSRGNSFEASQTLSVSFGGSSSGTTLRNGSVSISSGVLTYTPPVGFSGLDSVVYRVTDNGTPALFGTGTIQFNVTMVNDPPVAGPDSVTVREDEVIDIFVSNLLANDNVGGTSDTPTSESSTQSLTLIQVDQPTSPGGTVSLGGGKISYRPLANFHGTDTFTYVIRDNGVTNAQPDPKTTRGTVTVTVTEVNDVPALTNDTLTATEGVAKIFAATVLLANDLPGPSDEVSSQSISISSVQAVSANGGVVVLSGGVITYTPPAFFFGTDTFTYTVFDNGTTGGISDPKQSTASVQILVAEDNNAPIAGNDNFSTMEDRPLSITASTLTLNDVPGPANESNQTLTVTAVDSTSLRGGTVQLVNGVITYTPALDFSGNDSFVYTVMDNGTSAGISSPRGTIATVNINVISENDAPVANTDNVSGIEDLTTTIAVSVLSANDLPGPVGAASETGQTVTVTSVSSTSSAGGSVTLSNGQIFYTPPLNFNGVDTFTYTITDNGTTGGSPDPKSSVGTVTMNLSAVNDAPIANSDFVTAAEDNNGSAYLFSSLLTNDLPGPVAPTSTIDRETSQSLRVVGVGSVSFQGGNVTLTNGVIIYTPPQDFVGTDIFTYTIEDDGLTNGTLSPRQTVGSVFVTVTEVNDPPVPVVDFRSTQEDVGITVSAALLAQNDSAGPANESAQQLTIVSVNSTSSGGGLVSLSGGVITYTPKKDFFGIDTISYIVQDNGTTNGTADPKSSIGQLSVTVQGSNDAPTVVNDSYVMNEDTTLTVTAGNGILRNDFDADGDAFTAVNIAGAVNGSLSVASDGSFTFTPTQNFFGTVSFVYQARDSFVTSGLATVTITVNNTNEPPTAVADQASVTLGQEVSISVLNNDSDIDGIIDASSIQIIAGSGPVLGTAVVQNGSIRYTSSGNGTGTDTFRYTVRDTQGGISNEAIVSVGVTLAPPAWQNPTNHLDVNKDGFIAPIDALILINSVNSEGSRRLPANPGPNPEFYLDVDGDGFLTPSDIILIINYINSRSGGEGETPDAAPVIAATSQVTTAMPNTGMTNLNSSLTNLPTTDLLSTTNNQVLPVQQTKNVAQLLPTLQLVQPPTTGTSNSRGQARTDASKVSADALEMALDEILGEELAAQANESLADKALMSLLGE